jgi:hypothetical protein
MAYSQIIAVIVEHSVNIVNRDFELKLVIGYIFGTPFDNLLIEIHNNRWYFGPNQAVLIGFCSRLQEALLPSLCHTHVKQLILLIVLLLGILAGQPINATVAARVDPLVVHNVEADDLG